MDIFNIYFPIAQLDFNALLLIIIGFFVGILGGFFGVGGGWIVTLALNNFGFNMIFANGTGISQIFATSIIGTKKHSKLGNVDWKLGILSVVSSIIGVETGVQTIIYLDKYGHADIVIRIFYIVFLVTLGSYMLYDYYIIHKRLLRLKNESGNLTKKQKDETEETSSLAKKIQSFNLPPMIYLETSNISVSLWVILILFLFTGFLAGLMGVGGGFIILPSLIYLIGCPTLIAVGTSQLSLGLTAAFGTFSYALNGRVDVLASIYLFLGSAVGTQLGVNAVKYIKGYGIRLLFAVMIILTGFSVILKQLDVSFNISILGTFSSLIVLFAAGIVSMLILIRMYVNFRNTR